MSDGDKSAGEALSPQLKRNYSRRLSGRGVYDAKSRQRGAIGQLPIGNNRWKPDSPRCRGRLNWQFADSRHAG